MSLSNKLALATLGSAQSTFRSSTPVAPQRAQTGLRASQVKKSTQIKANQVTFQTPDGESKMECDGKAGSAVDQ